MDMKQRKLPSKALWVPMLWLGIISSKPISFWLGCLGFQSGSESNLEGNPLDLVGLLALIIAAFVILRKRNFDWIAFILKNKVLILLYLFLAVSAAWSEHPFPTIKRIVKDFGAVAIVLVMLTEKDPMDAIRIACVRVSYVLFPLSVIFIKYYPAIGRITGRTGDSMFCGVAWHKTSLGEVVFLFSLMIVLDLMEMRKDGEGSQRLAKCIRFGLLLMGAWLVHTCGSATAVVCFAIGCFLLWGSGRLVRFQNPGPILFRCAAVLLALFLAEKAFDLSGFALEALGKNRSLTGRTVIWEMAKEANSHALLGSGYYSFWSTESAVHIQKYFAGVMNSAHNGFLDMYLDGGLVGVALLLTMMLAWGARSIKRMLGGTLFGRVGFMIWVLAIIFNHSETAFFRLLPMWFVLLLMMIECPRPQPELVVDSDEEVIDVESELASRQADSHAEAENAEPEESLK